MYKKFTKPKILGRIYSLSGPEPPKTRRTDIRPHRTATPSAHGPAPPGPALPGTARHCPSRPSTTQHDSARPSTTRHDSAQPDTTQHNPTQLSTTRHCPALPVTARDGRRHGFSAPWRCPPAPSARRCWPPGPSPPNGNGQAASRQSSRPPLRFARARCG